MGRFLRRLRLRVNERCANNLGSSPHGISSTRRELLTKGELATNSAPANRESQESLSRQQAQNCAKVVLKERVALVLNIVGVIATRNRRLGPHWYPLALAALAMPIAWVGGILRVRQLRMQTMA